ncbi:hypothetical protein [Vibrio anguillarum]|uniref:hypothetical protein n=1 Tax=Vibrio anguillarum TaxID=55601 RepID=UPI0030B9B11E
MPKFGKRTVLEKEHFDEFYRAVGSDLTQVDEAQRQAFIDNHQMVVLLVYRYLPLACIYP